MGKHGENIRKRKDGRWEARVISAYDLCGKAKYRSFYGKTYLEAKEKRNNYIRNSSGSPHGKYADIPNNKKITVNQVMWEWMEFRKEYVKESTFAHYKNLLERHILPVFGNVYLSALTSEMINAFLKEQLNSGRADGKGGLSPKTVSDIRSVLLLGLEYARQQQYPCSVKSKIFSPKSCRPSKKILSRNEQSKLENFLYQHPEPVELGILTALYSGLRIGELCALQWGDIRHAEGTVRISKTIIRIQNVEQNDENGKKTRILISHPKTESSNRSVPLPSFIVDFLEKYRRETEIFLITGTKYPMEPRVYLSKYKQILKKAGLEPFTFHALRHTFATRCVESGFDTKSLSEILGHANVSTTLQNYVHPSLELKKEQMERLKMVSIWGRNAGQTDEKSADITPHPEKESYKENGFHVWHCRCDCGKEVDVRQSNLQNGWTRSCGCQRDPQKNLHYTDGTCLEMLRPDLMYKTNTSGVRGVYFSSKRNKWIAQIMFKQKCYYLGGYDNIEDAAKVRSEAEEKLFGDFLKWYKEERSKKAKQHQIKRLKYHQHGQK